MFLIYVSFSFSAHLCEFVMSNVPIALKLKQKKKHLYLSQQKEHLLHSNDVLLGDDNSNLNEIDEHIQSLENLEENSDDMEAIVEVDLTGNITKIRSKLLEKDKIEPLQESLLPQTKFTAYGSRNEKLKAPKKFKNTAARHSYSSKMDSAIESYIPMSQKTRVPYFCRVCECQIKCNNDEDFERHKRSEGHREKEKFDKQISFCHLCRKQFTSPDQLKEHKMGKWHHSRLASRRSGSVQPVNH
jgi:hypothetical protein